MTVWRYTIRILKRWDSATRRQGHSWVCSNHLDVCIILCIYFLLVFWVEITLSLHPVMAESCGLLAFLGLPYSFMLLFLSPWVQNFIIIRMGFTFRAVTWSIYGHNYAYHKTLFQHRGFSFIPSIVAISIINFTYQISVSSMQFCHRTFTPVLIKIFPLSLMHLFANIWIFSLYVKVSWWILALDVLLYLAIDLMVVG